jgi:hypothetical protein
LNTPKDGGPAFPRPAFDAPTGEPTSALSHDEQDGMSLREWFAGQAVAGLLAGDLLKPHANHSGLPFGPALVDAETVAVLAFGIADAMIAARKKGGAS